MCVVVKVDKIIKAAFANASDFKKLFWRFFYEKEMSCIEKEISGIVDYNGCIIGFYAWRG